MRRSLKVITLALAATLVLGVLAVGAAWAADPPANPGGYQNTFIAKVAKILGKSEQEVKDAFIQAGSEMIDEGVAAGRIPADRAELMKERLQSGTCPGGMMGERLKNRAQRMEMLRDRLQNGELPEGKWGERRGGRLGGMWNKATPTPTE